MMTPRSTWQQVVRHLGISVSNLQLIDLPRQLDFMDLNREKYQKIIKSMYQLRDLWGENVLTWGSLVR